jgi:hypothetical protein
MKRILTFVLIAAVIPAMTSCGLVYFGVAAAAGGGGGGGVAALNITTDANLTSGKQKYAYAGAQFAATGGTAPYSWVTVGGGALPAGMSLNSSGYLGGTPTNFGNFSFTAQVSDSASRSKNKDFYVVIDGGLKIITATPLNGAVVGEEYSVTFEAENGVEPYTWGLASGAWPTGLSLFANGTLCGTPTVDGNFNFDIIVTDNDAITDTKSFLLNATLAPLDITTATPLPDGKVQYQYSPLQFEATGGTTPYTWLVVGALPTGLSLNSSGCLFGTPTTMGYYSFNVQVTDSGSRSKAESFSCMIQGGLVVTTASPLPSGSRGLMYDQTFQAANGALPYTWTLFPGDSLPGGFTLSNSGQISGVPGMGGTYDFTIVVTDNDSKTASKQFHLVIDAGVVVTTTSPLTTGTAGEFYSVTLQADNGAAPYAWSKTAGTIPGGLTLANSGLLSGTPQQAGNYSFTVQAMDNSGVTASKALAVTINEEPAISVTNVAPSVLGKSDLSRITWKSNRAGNYTIELGGGGQMGNGAVLLGPMPCAAGIPVVTTVLEADIPDNQSTEVWIYVEITSPVETLCASVTLYDDQKNPTSLIMVPEDNQSIGGLELVSGIAFDNGGGSVTKVEIAIQEIATSLYWDGTGFNSSTIIWLTAPGTERWTYNVSGVTFEDTKSYRIKSRAYDSVDNVENPSAGVMFTMDSNLPVVTISSVSPRVIGPLQASAVRWSCTHDGSYLVEAGGNGAPGSGSQIENGSCFASVAVTTPVNESNIADNTTATIYVIVTDNAAQTAFAFTDITDDHIPPAVFITFPANGSTINGASQIIGNASDTGGSVVHRVEIAISSGGLYYDGIGFDCTNIITYPALGSSAWTFDTSDIPWQNGNNHTITAFAYDCATNVSSPATSTFLYNTGGTGPGTASNPDPANFEDNVAITATILSWSAATGADGYNVYYGLDGAPAFIGYQTTRTYNPGTLTYDTTYEWRIDSVGAGGTTTGAVWKFHTEPAPVPAQATNPTPPDGAIDVLPSVMFAWNGSGIADQYNIYLDNSPGLTEADIVAMVTDNSWSPSPGALQFGQTYYWRVDSVGQYATKTGVEWTFATKAADVTAPSITIENPTVTPYYTTEASVNVTGNASDDTGVSYVHWSNVNTGAEGNASGAANWAASISLQPGNNTIVCTAYDEAGNFQSALTVVLQDTQDPSVSITTPTAGGYLATTSSTISLGGTACDDIGVVYAHWYNNSTSGEGNAVGTDSWTADNIPLTIGLNNITVTVFDYLGRNGTDVITVVMDTIPPSAAISSPSAGGYYLTKQASALVSGTASDADTSVAYVSWSNTTTGAYGNASGTTSWFTGSITLQTGNNSIVIIAYDAVGNFASDNITIECDNVPPSVAITAPSVDPYYIAANTADLSGNSSDNRGVRIVWWTNATTAVSGNVSGTVSNWTASSIGLQNGSNLVRVYAEDNAGNVSYDETTVFRDETVPAITITGPTSQEFYLMDASVVALSGTAADNGAMDYIYYVNTTTGDNGTITAVANWSTGSIPLQYGNNSITARVYDKAGNFATDIITICRDDVAPTVSIESPTNGDYLEYTSNALPLAGCASDMNLYRVTWNNFTTSESGTASGLESWSVGAIGLLPGNNTIQVTAEDLLGYSAYDTLIVNCISAAPSVTIISPTIEPLYYTGSPAVGLNGTVTDTGPVDNVTWYNTTRTEGGNCDLAQPAWGVGGISLCSGTAPVEKVSDFAWRYNSTMGIQGSYWYGFVFKPSRSGTLSKLQIMMGTYGIPPDLVITLHNAAGGIPDGGAPLYTTTMTYNLFDNNYDIINLENAGIAVTAGNEYTVEFHAFGDGGDWNNYYYFYMTYEAWNDNCHMLTSYAGDANWFAEYDKDPWFKAYVMEDDYPNVENIIQVTAFDPDGNNGSDEIAVRIDTTPPDITAEWPFYYTYYSTNEYASLYGVISDNWKVDYVKWRNSTTGESGTASGTDWWYVDNVRLNYGNNSITVVAYDKAGHASMEIYTTVIFDNTAPAIEVNTPVESPFYTSDGTLYAQGNVSDDVSVYYINWYNDSFGTAGGIGFDENGNWESYIGLVAGTNSIRFIAYDRAYNTCEKTITVYCDQNNPSISIDVPLEDVYYTTSSTITLYGTASDLESGLSCISWENYYFGLAGNASGLGAWNTGNILLGEGNNSIVVTACDLASNIATDCITVIRDNTNPTCSITLPSASGSYYTTSSAVVIQGCASDVNLYYVQYQVGAGAWQAATGTTSWTTGSIGLSNNAWTTIRAVAYDRAGNYSSSSSISVWFDGLPPTITITSPASSPYYVSSSSVGVSGTAYDLGCISYIKWQNTTSGTSGNASGTTAWSCTATGLLAGNNTIVMTAYDLSGRSATASVIVTYDSVSPTIAITQPTTDTRYYTVRYYTGSPSQFFNGTYSDNYGVQGVTWYESGNATNYGACSYADNSWSTNLNLHPGYNYLRFKATDLSGRYREDYIYVYYKKMMYMSVRAGGNESFTDIATTYMDGNTASIHFVAEEFVDNGSYDYYNYRTGWFWDPGNVWQNANYITTTPQIFRSYNDTGTIYYGMTADCSNTRRYSAWTRANYSLGMMTTFYPYYNYNSSLTSIYALTYTDNCANIEMCVEPDGTRHHVYKYSHPSCNYLWYRWNNGYYDITYNTIVEYSSGMTDVDINGSNLTYANNLQFGTTLIYTTDQGRYGKMRISSYGTDLTITWTTYNVGGTVYSSGSGVVVHGTWYCDLDCGVETSNPAVADFQWRADTAVLKRMVSYNGALFAVAGCYRLDSPMDSSMHNLTMFDNMLYMSYDNSGTVQFNHTYGDPFLQSNWEGREAVPIGTGSAANTYTISDGNNVFVAWSEYLAGTYSIKYNQRGISPVGFWGGATLLVQDAVSPQIFIDNHNSINVIYKQYSTNIFYYMFGLGTFWSSPYSMGSIGAGGLYDAKYDRNTETMHIGFASGIYMYYRQVFER